MNEWIEKTRRWSGLAALLWSLSGAQGAQAAPASYQCIGYRPLEAVFAPTHALIDFGGEHWDLRRVRDDHAARYADARAGVSVTLKDRDMEFTHPGETVHCVLLTNALKGMALPASAPASVRPATAPPASGAASAPR